MRRISFRAAALALAVAGPASGASAESFTCTEPDGRAVSRVVGGSAMDHAEAPYQVVLLKLNTAGEPVSLCGGSLISRGHVLTAAHCVTDLRATGFVANTPRQFEVLYGGDDIARMREAGQTATIRRVDVHPGFHSRGRLSNDVAVLTLSRSLDVPLSSIVQIASSRMEQALMPPYTCARVTGYGRTDSGKISRTMQSVDMFIRPRADCERFADDLSNRMGRDLSITDAMICAGYDGGQKSSCKGDSGGPLVIREGPSRWVQVGIVSWGDPKDCAQIGNFGVYARVSSFADWIVEVASR